MIINQFINFAIFIAFAFATPAEKSPDTEVIASKWQSLFNGKDLDDWRIKISKHDYRDNYNNTFRVEDGLMKVRYDEYDDFDRQYGHIFYKDAFSYYLLRVEYRFVGEQAPGGEGWALRNSGVMLHGQAPETMTKDQDFPISIEAQLLGGDGENERTTGNLCTPGTNVEMDGELFTSHCISSSSETYHGEQWVTADFLVLGDSIIHHIIEGDTVMTYQKPQIGGGNVSNHDSAQKEDGKLITKGHFSLQSESHPIDFRRVDIFDLEDYKDDQAKMQMVLSALKAE